MLLSSSGMSSSDASAQALLYPEVSGRRVLITGVTRCFGNDIARMFAEAGARLIVQYDEDAPELAILNQTMATCAQSLSVRTGAFASVDQMVSFGRSAAQELGGIDVVVNAIQLAGPLLPDTQSMEAEDIEGLVGDLLTPACLVSRIAANRMRLTLTEGLILNLATVSPDADRNRRAFAQVAKAALAAMTRREAANWVDQGIRFNAVAPQVHSGLGGGGLGGEMDVAALALYLASGRGKSLTGHTFEAEPLPTTFN